MEARHISFVACPLHCLCLSESGGPKGGAPVASHVFALANDKVAATGFMNYAGERGSNSALSYVNGTSGRHREGHALLCVFYCQMILGEQDTETMLRDFL